MNKKKLFLALLIIGCSNQNQETMKAPIAKKIPVTYSAHGDIRIDNYDWLRDDTRKKEEVLEYLRLENEYADSWFNNQNNNYQEKIVDELISRVPNEEVSYPRDNYGVKYFTKSFQDKQLDIYFKSDNEVESLIFDPNIKFNSQDYYQVSRFNPSPSNELAAFSEDNDGRRKYVTKFLDLNTNKLIGDELKLTSGNMIWSQDSKKIFYLKKDPNTLISNKLYMHVIGKTQLEDELIYEELDSEFNLGIYQSSSKQYLILNIEKTNSNEIRLLELKTSSNNQIKVFLEREEDHLYSIDHSEDTFLIKTNLDSPNYRITQTKNSFIKKINDTEEIVAHDPDVYIQDFLITKSYLILEIRKNGLPAIRKMNKESLSLIDLEFPDQSYFASLASSDYVNFNKDEFYYYYSSPNRPTAIYRFNANQNNSEKVWQKKINNFNEDDYVVERIFNEARDGTMVPATIVYKKNTNLSSPILFYGYGSYGINIEARFRESILPLLDNGFIYAYLNIRGGGEMGKYWYEQGRMLNKLNTFFDFNDSVRSTLNKGYGDKLNVFAQGGSAGGLLMGAIINLEPDLYKGILNGVPFVDVLTTMSDPSIPLTTFEYDEWGNPAIKEEYLYMKKYSPYDNIKELNYPAVFVTSSLYDSQVQYFEPAKYVPKLREFNQSNNPILMKMNLIGGHGGLSGKINQFNEIAEEYNFIINLVD